MEYMDVSKNRGGPPKWMVYFMEKPIKMDDLEVPLFLETLTYEYVTSYTSFNRELFFLTTLGGDLVLFCIPIFSSIGGSGS